MTKIVCDICGKIVFGQLMNFSYPCHHGKDFNRLASGYEDKDGNQCSYKYESIDLCNKCSNELFSFSMKKIEDMKQIGVK